MTRLEQEARDRCSSTDCTNQSKKEIACNLLTSQCPKQATVFECARVYDHDCFSCWMRECVDGTVVNLG